MIMRIVLWADKKGEAFSRAETLGYDLNYPGTEQNVSGIPEIFSHAQKIYECGLNVMVKHSEDESIIFVDYSRFSQR